MKYYLVLMMPKYSYLDAEGSRGNVGVGRRFHLQKRLCTNVCSSKPLHLKLEC